MYAAIMLLGLLLPMSAHAAPNIEQGRVLYAQTCVKCHDNTATQERLQGPPLFNVVGRKVGLVKGFGYSDAMK